MTDVTRKKFESRARGSRVERVVSAGDLSDEALVVLLRARDERGFDGAYARYSANIFGFLLRLGRSRALAEDLFQHTFLRLAERGPELAPGSELRAWLFAVARNAFHSQARASAVAARATDFVPPPQTPYGADAVLALTELERALARLETSDRELLLLIGVEGLGHAEVAGMLRIDLAALRKRLSRARARLADALDELEFDVRNSKVER